MQTVTLRNAMLRMAWTLIGLVCLSNHQHANAQPAFELNGLLSSPPPHSRCTEFHLADFNNDGLSDCFGVEDKTGGGAIYVFLNSGNGQYKPTATHLPGGYVSSAAAAHFNRDGFTDIAIALISGIKIYLGNGDGTFNEQAVIPSPSDAFSEMTAPDINGDGLADLAGRNSSVVCRINLGNNNFGPLQTLSSASAFAWEMVTADFDGDGYSDVVCANSNSNNGLEWFKSNGLTLTHPSSQLSGYSYFEDVTVGDVNDDSTTDIVATNNSTVQILLNDGAGNFSPMGPVSISDGSSVAIADLDEDGSAEIISASSNSGYFRVIRRQGSSFVLAEQVPMGGEFVVMGNDNNDSFPDFYSMNSVAGFVVSIARNAGVAPWVGSTITTSALFDSTFEATYADVDRDGIVDLLRPEYFSNRVSILKGTGSGSFQTSLTLSLPMAFSVHSADINKDGWPDIIGNSLSTSSGYIAVFLADKNGGFLPAIQVMSGTPCRAPISADWNYDGNLDIACTVSSQAALKVCYGNGTGGFAAPVTLITTSSPRCCTTADFDNNGTLDIAVGASGTASVFWNNGSGTFTRNDYPASSGAEYIRPVDYDRNGTMDILCSNQDKALLSNHRNRVFTQVLYIDGSLQGPDATGDINEDGLPDFLLNMASGHLGSRLSSEGVASLNAFDHSVNRMHSLYPLFDLDRDGHLDASIPTNRPEGFRLSAFLHQAGSRSIRFQDPVTAPGAGEVTEILSPGDLNNDGLEDAIALTQNPAHLAMWSQSAGTLQLKQALPITEGTVGLSAGDFNRDGWQDMATAAFNKLQIFAGGETGFAALAPVTLPARAYDIVVVDMNRDARLDIVAALSDRTLVLLNGDGAGSFTLSQTRFVGDISESLTAEDFNRDGFPDIVALFKASGSAVLFPGSGTMGPAAGTWFMGNSPEHADSADINRDGLSDLTAIDGNRLVVRFGLPGGQFGTINTSLVEWPRSRPTLKDFNKDGFLDLLIYPDRQQFSEIHIYAGDGSGKFDNLTLTPSPGRGPIAAGEFTGDDRLDIVATNDLNNNIAFHKGAGGNYGLHASPTGVTAVPSGNMDAVLSATLYNRHKPGEASIALRQIGLKILHDDGRVPTSGEANNVIDEIRVYRDNMNGLFEPDADVCVSTKKDIQFYPDAVTSLTLTARLEDEVMPGEKAGYFVAVQSTENAFQFPDSQMSLTLLGDLHQYTLAVEARTRGALVAEWTTNTMTSTIALPVSMSGFTLD